MVESVNAAMCGNACFLSAAGCLPRGHPRAQRLLEKRYNSSSCQEEGCASGPAPQTEPCKNTGELPCIDRIPRHRWF